MDIEEAWRREYRIHLETPRVLLRPLIADDADWLADIFMDPEVYRLLLDEASGPSDEIALSYVLRRASWGQGIAAETAARLLRCAFEVHQLGRVMAVIVAGNTPSRRVLKKLGMRFIKTVRSADGKDLRYFRIDAPAGFPDADLRGVWTTALGRSSSSGCSHSTFAHFIWSWATRMLP